MPDRCIEVDIPWPNNNNLRTVALSKFSEVLPAFKGYKVSGSAGELSLLSLPSNQRISDETKTGTSPYMIEAPTVYDAVNGKPIGILLTTLTRSGYDQDYASVQYLTYRMPSKVKPRIIQRRIDDASLLFYEQKKAWVNFSSIPDQPLWINLAEVTAWANLYQNRDTVIKNASRIEVRSPHNLRSAPNIESEIIQVMGTGKEADILPLAINGDWMKVHYVSPSPVPKTEEGNPISLKSLGPEYQQIQGWIKFRNSPTKELINIVYDSFYPVVYDYTEFTSERR